VQVSGHLYIFVGLPTEKELLVLIGQDMGDSPSQVSLCWLRGVPDSTQMPGRNRGRFGIEVEYISDCPEEFCGNCRPVTYSSKCPTGYHFLKTKLNYNLSKNNAEIMGLQYYNCCMFSSG